MQARHVLLKVDDQDKALAFYTTKLGFVKKRDLTMGKFRWLTVVALEEAEGVEIVLETDAFPVVRQTKKLLYDKGFPVTVLTTNDIHADYRRLKDQGVAFRGQPKDVGSVISVFFDDSCGNIINLQQPKSQPVQASQPVQQG